MAERLMFEEVAVERLKSCDKDLEPCAPASLSRKPVPKSDKPASQTNYRARLNTEK